MKGRVRGSSSAGLPEFLRLLFNKWMNSKVPKDEKSSRLLEIWMKFTIALYANFISAAIHGHNSPHIPL
jgi:hypothetical protein